jgi:hypothetical protein
MVRPSIRSTQILSSVRWTSLIRSPALGSEVAMPSLQQFSLVVICDGFYFPELLGAKTKVVSQTDRRKPKLRRLISPVNMDMRRLIWFMTVEIEAVWTGSKNNGSQWPHSSKDREPQCNKSLSEPSIHPGCWDDGSCDSIRRTRPRCLGLSTQHAPRASPGQDGLCTAATNCPGDSQCGAK